MAYMFVRGTCVCLHSDRKDLTHRRGTYPRYSLNHAVRSHLSAIEIIVLIADVPSAHKGTNCSGAGSAAPRSTKLWAVYKHYDVDVCAYPYYSDILAKQSTLPGSSYVV